MTEDGSALLGDAVDRGDGRAAVDILIGDLATHANGPDWTWQRREALRLLIVGHRDMGHCAEAHRAFLEAMKLWPEDPIFAVEILVLGEDRGLLTDSQFEEFAAQLSSNVKRHPTVWVFIAIRHARHGDTESGLKLLEELASSEDHQPAWLIDRLHTLAKLIIGQQVQHEQLAGQSSQATAEPMIETLAAFLAAVDRIGSIESIVRGIAFANIFGMPNAGQAVLRALSSRCDKLTIDGKSSLIMLMVAYHQFESARDVVHQVLRDHPAQTSSFFTKGAVRCASALKDAVLERRLLEGYARSQDISESSSSAQARSSEIRRRAHSLGADRPIRLFVGLFGQARDPEYIIPRIISGIESDLDRSAVGAFDRHYAVSTWAKTGGRRWSPSDETDFFRQVLPNPLQPLLHSAVGASGSDVAKSYPALINAVINYMNSQSSMTLDKRQVETLLPPGSSVRIDDESLTEEEVRRASSISPEEKIPQINQYKMWSRLSALSELVDQAERQEGTEFDAFLLLRADLDYIGGDLADLIVRVCLPYESGVVFCDFDAHAEFIEGAGDRYLVFNRRSLDIFKEGYRRHLEVANGADPGFEGRLGGHQMLSTMVFERGLAISPVYSINYAIHRGSIPPEILLMALEDDWRHASPTQHRGELEKAIAALKGVAS